MKNKLIAIISLTLMLAMIPTSNASAKAKPKLSKTSITITKGKTYTLKVNNNKKKAKWSTKSKKIATVTSKGKVKGINAGTTYVYAKVGNKKFKCKVSVKNPTVANNSPSTASSTETDRTPSTNNTTTDFTLSSSHLEMNLRTSQKLYTTGNNTSIKWSVLNDDVATIDQNGNIQSVGPGTTFVIASCGNTKEFCQVDVIYDYARDYEYIKSHTTINYNRTGMYVNVYGTNNNTHSVSINLSDTYRVTSPSTNPTDEYVSTTEQYTTDSYINSGLSKTIPANSDFNYTIKLDKMENYINDGYTINNVYISVYTSMNHYLYK